MDNHMEELVIFHQQGHIHVGTICASNMLKMQNIAQFGQVVLEYVQQHPGLNLLLNFENVDYLSSAVLTELLRIKERIEQVNGRLRLCAVAPTIQQIFEITRLNTVFAIHGESVDLDSRRFERSIELEEEDKKWNR